MTHQGQVKHGKTRHEKDDRRSVGDHRYWVLGFDNREKLVLYRAKAQELAGKFSQLEQQIKALADREASRARRAIHCQTLVNLRWQEVDVAPLLTGIEQMEHRIREALEGNKELKIVAAQIEPQRLVVADADKALRKTKIKYEKVIGIAKEHQQTLQSLQDDPSIVALTPHQQRGLDERFDTLAAPVRLENLDKLIRSVERTIRDEIETLTRNMSSCEGSSKDNSTNSSLSGLPNRRDSTPRWRLRPILLPN